MADEDQHDESDAAAEAFENVRAEVALLRRAIERLTAERVEVAETPDYSETLGVISQNLSATAQRVDALVRSPALALTPDAISLQVAAAGYKARVEDHRALTGAKQGMDEVTARLGRYLQSDIAAGEQRRWLGYAGLIGLALGMAVWAILAGPIARAVPASWLWPERMAARTLRMPMWEGGQRLMRAGDAQAFAGVLAGNRIATLNRDTLEACHKQATKAKRAVRCAIEVEAKD